MRSACRDWIAALIVLLVAGLACAQGTTSKVVGVVSDPTGAVILGASVTLKSESTGVSFTTQTTGAGTYVFESVQIGSYTLTVEAPGFKKFVSAGNQLTIGQPLTVNVKLELGNVNQVVEVSGGAEVVQTSTSGNFGNLVDNRELTSLPIVGTRGRNPLQFVDFQPGVAVGANTGGGVHVHGSRDRAWNFTLDGVDINESSAGGSDFSPLRSNPDSLTEFRVLTGQFTAEYGRSSGGQVALVSRSGTNEFHGDAFYFYRTPGLNANEWRNNRLGLSRPQFVQHVGGFSFGGPVIKNKTFFFSNLQVLRASTSGVVTSIVYTNAARNGLFRYVTSACPGQSKPQNSPACVDSNGNPLPGVAVATYNIVDNDPARRGLDPSIKSFIGLTPLPNDFTTGDGLNTAGFSFVAPGGEKQEDWVIKVDHVINAKNTIFGRWALGRQLTLGDRVNGGAQSFPNTPRVVDTNRTPRNLAINWRTNPTSRITNEFVFGWNHFTFDFLNPDPNFKKNPPFVLNNVTNPLFNSLGNLRTINSYQWVDNFSYVRGSHAFKAGINFRYQQHKDLRGSVAGENVEPAVDFTTRNTVDTIAFGLPSNINSTDLDRLRGTINDLLGRVGRISRAFVASSDSSAFAPGGTPFNFDARYPEYDFYVQDTWKIRPNLTLDLGLRWELRLTPRAASGRMLVPDKPVLAGAPPSNTLKWVPGDLYNSDRNNLSPSIGIAWDPFGTGKTSIRANYRLAYDRFNTFVFSSRIYQSLPGQVLAVSNTTFGTAGGRLRDGLPTLSPSGTPADLVQPARFSTNTQVVVDANSLKSPETHMWGLSIQRDLGHNVVFEMAYNGRHGVHLFGGYNVNAVNIRAFDLTCKEDFLQAFNTVRTGGNSCLMNALFSSDKSLKVSGSQFVRQNFKTPLERGSLASLASIISDRTVPAGQMIALSGFSPFFFKPYPQFSGGLLVLDSNDFSFYHDLEVQLSRRFVSGLGFQVSYTFAKSLDNRSFDPTFSVVNGGTLQSASSTPWDIFNRKLNKARSDFDRRHSLQSYWVYELPLGKGRRWASNLNGVLERIVGGWSVNGILIWTSGRPFTVYSDSFTVSNVVSSPAQCTGCSPSNGQLHREGSNNQIFWFTPEERARFSLPSVAPEPGKLGNTGRNFFTTAKFFNLDLGIGKTTRVTEKQSLEFRFEMQNATNTPKWDDNPTAAVTSPNFGRLLDPSLTARKMQLVFKYHF